MFSFAKDSESLEEIRVALMDVFAKRVEKDMDNLWDSGKWDNEKKTKQFTRTQADSFPVKPFQESILAPPLAAFHPKFALRS